MTSLRSCLLALPLLAACSDPNGRTFFGADTGPGSDVAAQDASSNPPDVVQRDITLPPTDAPPLPDDTIVYAHSDTTLYAVDPRTNGVRTVGTFSFPAGDTNHHTMTDLAVDGMGNLVGNTSNALYRVNATSAACTLLATLPGSHTFVGLTYVPVGLLDPLAEVLIGGATDGTFWRIDTGSGNATQLGQFSGGWGLSGDFVSIDGAATYATVRQSASTHANDSLATLDVHTGQLTIVGDTGFSSIYGLGYWRATLFGFTHTGQFIIIDPRSGRGHQVAMPTMQFSGAGVTTLAPIAPQ